MGSTGSIEPVLITTKLIRATDKKSLPTKDVNEWIGEPLFSTKGSVIDEQSRQAQRPCFGPC